MENTNSIAITAVCDNHYTVLLAALIKSIEVNHSTQEIIECFIVEDGVTTRNKQKLEASVDSDKILVHWVSIDEAIPENMYLPLDRSTYPKNIYTRIFIPYFVPDRFAKVIYLDVDMILMTDISKLWNIDLEENIVGAVMDPRLKVFSNEWGGVLNYKELGFDPDTKYFNTGLLVINTKKFRENNIAQKVIQCIEENEKYANYPDQYGLNITLANVWHELDPKWNWFASDECKDPYLIHFIGRKPIYKAYAYSKKYQETFFTYLNKTQWNGFKILGETSRYSKKIKNIIHKIPALLSGNK